MQLVSKISNLCGPDFGSGPHRLVIHQRHTRADGLTDGQTTCNRNSAPCTIVHRHRAVKTINVHVEARFVNIARLVMMKSSLKLSICNSTSRAFSSILKCMLKLTFSGRIGLPAVWLVRQLNVSFYIYLSTANHLSPLACCCMRSDEVVSLRETGNVDARQRRVKSG